MPAFLSLPFVAIFKSLWQQQFLAHILGAGIVCVNAALAFSIRKNRTIALWVGLLAGFGTVIWFLSSVGSSWYLGQLSAAFFLSLALYESFAKKRPILVGLLLGAAYLSRIHTILSVVFFIHLFRAEFKKIFLFLLGILPALAINALYNFARFGVLWDKGYVLIPGVLEEPWYKLGIIHPSYIVRHLKVIFLSLPVFQEKFPFILPSWGGLAIWVTSPALFVAILAPFNKPVIKMAVLSGGLIAAPILMHGTTGFAQFGYRFLVDLIPFIFLLIMHALPEKLKWWHWALLFFSILVNAWGVIVINKLGLAG